MKAFRLWTKMAASISVQKGTLDMAALIFSLPNWTRTAIGKRPKILASRSTVRLTIFLSTSMVVGKMACLLPHEMVATFETELFVQVSLDFLFLKQIL